VSQVTFGHKTPTTKEEMKKAESKKKALPTVELEQNSKAKDDVTDLQKEETKES
jgi:hypothetical protein